MHDFQDAFISYGRADSKAFAIKLQQRLTEQKLKVWFDQNDIPLAVDYQNQIDDGIEKADNFVFIISPHSVNSLYCQKELAAAIHYNKRIIPLLHVEQISQETWQQRTDGDDAAWKAYTAAGLHSSFVNMHPLIAKLNWLYFRDGIEDFEQALSSLLTLFDRHRDYVKQHTYFLTRALEWERQQKQSRCLLIGEHCQQAEDWLKVQFQDQQPPCIPTDLHCEYITESVKNANNLMTQVFLAHAEEEAEFSEQVRCSLMRQGLTVWTNKTDIRTGVEFQGAIDRGIEEADTVVYLLSPASLRSTYCQHEIEYALSLNKRIIPLLAKEIDPAQVPSTIRTLQYIDLTDNIVEADYRQDESQLIKALNQDATYYEQHKILLAKALKWERQNRNPSLLLRGYNLRYAESWLKAASQHSQHPATALQKEFIQAGLSQPLERSLDVFVSYSRVDSDFARRLNEALQNQGKTTWFDQESIASGSEWQSEIFRGIEAANNFLFIISPSSINSPYCVNEVEYAQKLNKRVVTVLYRPVSLADLPNCLAGVQWIDFNRHNRDFLINFGELVRTIDTDFDYTRLHTRLLVRAIEWETAGYDPSFLLRGKELVDAEQWLRSNKQPQPSDRHRHYITTSRKAPLRKPTVRTAAVASLAASLLMIAARFLGLLQPVELAAYDQLMRWKPNEPKDDRLLLVEIDEDDIQTQNQAYSRGRGTLPDPALAQLLDKLQQAQPRVVGLDLYRDFATDQAALANRLQRDKNFVVLCKLSTSDGKGIQPAKELPSAQFSQRLGFSDFAADSGTMIRRHLLVHPPDRTCPTENAFSLAIARQYLEAAGKPYAAPFTPDGDFVQALRFGTASFPRLYPFSGGYQGASVGGYQSLLNYRRYQGNPSEFIDRVKLRDVLANQVAADKIKDRMVLIGVTSRASVNDYWMTPLGEIPGVMVQAQMASQIVSATIDGRPLIWWLPFWGDAIWIVGWGLVGGGIVWAIQHPRRLIVIAIVTIGAVWIVCYGIFAFSSGWLPLVPSVLAIVLAGGITLGATHWLKR